MTEPSLSVVLALDNKTVDVLYKPNISTAEEICIHLCKQLGIGTVARHLFALQISSKQHFLIPSEKLSERELNFTLRIRYKVSNTEKLRKLDGKAYDYYYHQVRNDVVENKVQDLEFKRYGSSLVGLGVTDMYRVMLEKDIPMDTILSDYKKYIPKEAIKKYAIFLKQPVRMSLLNIKKTGVSPL